MNTRKFMVQIRRFSPDRTEMILLEEENPYPVLQYPHVETVMLESGFELRAKLALAFAWMSANIPEMDCRGDEDCDHCHGLQILSKMRGEK
jgi:hypothetical protein